MTTTESKARAFKTKKFSKDADNIGDDDLVALKRLAKLYQQLSPSELAALIATKEFVEICHDD
jgi:hypothetical protein